MAVASPFGFCAIFSLKEVHSIAREIESSNPAHPATFSPFVEVQISLPALDSMLNLLGTIHKNGWSRPENGFSATTFAREAPGYATSTSCAEKWDIHSSIYLGQAPRARECETKQMQWPKITPRRQKPVDAHPFHAMDFFHYCHRD
jgi:hypothetical protein